MASYFGDFDPPYPSDLGPAPSPKGVAPLVARALREGDRQGIPRPHEKCRLVVNDDAGERVAPTKEEQTEFDLALHDELHGSGD